MKGEGCADRTGMRQPLNSRRLIEEGQRRGEVGEGQAMEVGLPVMAALQGIVILAVAAGMLA